MMMIRCSSSNRLLRAKHRVSKFCDPKAQLSNLTNDRGRPLCQTAQPCLRHQSARPMPIHAACLTRESRHNSSFLGAVLRPYARSKQTFVFRTRVKKMASSASSIGSWEAPDVLARVIAATRAAFKFDFDERKFMLLVTSTHMEPI
jgi:hypothetical protein